MSKTPFMEVGGRYLFNYEAEENTPWVCVDIAGDGWATLRRPSKDYKGDYRPSTTPVETKTASLLMRRLPNTHVLYFDADTVGWELSNTGYDAIKLYAMNKVPNYRQIKFEFDEQGKIISVELIGLTSEEETL